MGCVPPLLLLLLDDIGDSVREHTIRGGQHIERFPKQDDLAVGCRAVTEEALMDELARDPRLLVNGVFAEGLFWRVDVDLHIDKLEVRIHLLVQKGEKRSDVSWSFIPRINAEICEIR